MTSGDPRSERIVHAFRVKTAKVLARAGKEKETKRVARILRLTIKKAMAKNPEATVKLIEKEFRQLIDKQVWHVLTTSRAPR